MQGVNDLTQGNINRQLFNLSMPILATSFIQMAYNLTDMAWVGHLSSEAVAAIGAAGIFTWLANSVALLNKVGSEVSVGQAIGANDKEGVRLFASHNITLSFIFAICCASILFLGAKPIIGIYGLEASIADRAVVYLRIVSSAFPFVFLSASMSGIYNAAGRSKRPFYINSVGLLLNTILDPILIYGFKLETNGAAIATWISQALVFIIMYRQLFRKDILLGKMSFLTRLKKRYTLRILKIGLPVTLLNGLFAIVSMLLGRVASEAGGHIGLMALTTGGQIEAIAWNTAQGFSTALSTFVAQNYAAGQIKRVMRAWHISLYMTVIIGLMSMLLFVGFGDTIFSIFVPEEAAYKAGGAFLRIDGYSMPLMILEITMQGIFYGLGRTILPAVNSILFNYLRIPVAILLIHTFLGVEGIWWAISLSTMCKGFCLFIAFLFLKKKIRLTKGNWTQTSI